MSTSTEKTSYHHGDLRNALLDAAASAARDLGPDTLTLREVARRAQVSHTAAYNHFADKRDLLRGLAVRAFVELGDRLTAAAGRDGAEIAAIALVYVRFAWQFPTEFRFMFQRSLCMPEGVPDPIEIASRSSREVLRDIVAVSQAGGRMRAGDVDELALACWAHIHGVTTIMLETPAFKSISLAGAEATLLGSLRLLIDGLRPGTIDSPTTRR